MAERLRITKEELADPRIDRALEREREFRAVAAAGRVGRFRRLVYSSMFYTALLGALGGFVGWAVMEPLVRDLLEVRGTVTEVFEGGVVGGCAACGKIRVLHDGEDPRCPGCGGELGRSEFREVAGVVVLERTQVFVVRGLTKLGPRGEDRPMDGTAGLSAGVGVLVRGAPLENQEAFERQSMVAHRIEVLPGAGPEGGGGEPDLAEAARADFWGHLLFFAVVGGMVALMVGAGEGLVSRNLRQALVCGGAGLGIGFAGGLVGVVPASLLYQVSNVVTEGLSGSGGFGGIEDLHGLPLFAQIVGRSLAWGAVGTTLALGQGIIRRSRSLALHGLLGGCLGGLLGGMLFDPIDKLWGAESAELSRAVGLLVVGLLIGFFIGVVEQVAKEAWLLRRAGPLKGKQHVVYRSVTTIGSAASADIYLFRDPRVRPEHARLHRVGRTYEIEDLGDAGETLVNGVAVRERLLRDGDRISVGETVLEFRSRVV